MENSTKRTTVRANHAQTVMLRDAFTQSNTISPDDLKTLSEKTNLPEKWIHLWFGRQRVKARKIVIDPGPIASGSDRVLSTQEILQVKMEYRDSLVPRSSSPALSVGSVVGPTLDENVSQSSENHPPTKKPRVSQPRAQRAKKKQANVRNILVKTANTDPVVNALGNPASATSSMAQSSTACDSFHLPGLNEAPLVIQSVFPFPRIAPPSRTPLTSASISAQGEDRQSHLSTNQSYRIYSPVNTNATTVNAAGSQLPPSIFTFSKPAAVYQQGPIFRTPFYNNGPANYQNPLSNLGTLRSDHTLAPNPGPYLAEFLLPVSDVSGRQNIPKQVGLEEHFSHSLGPAIVLENASKPMASAVTPMNNYLGYPSSSPAQHIGSSIFTEDLLYPPHSGRSNHEETSFKADPENVDISIQYNNLLMSPMDASQTFPTFYNEALDPSLAPLKHLTDILGEFRDQDGTYTKLVDLQEREGLMKCLLDDELARRSPFQAAMGLVLLSKLGLEWDY